MSASELPAYPPSDYLSADAVPTGSEVPAETRLRLLGLTPDRERLLMVDATGVEFTMPIDARLRAALHGDPARSHQPNSAPTSEKTMETMLRPRDIQTRIRSGETPEAVAQAACCTVEKIMPYAAPVLAEREHVAQRALRASLRRSSGEQNALGRTLGEAVSSRLRAMNVDPDSVVWDAWRREDGRWALTATFSAGGYDGLAEMTFDQPGNFVLLDNDEARWLVGEQLPDPVDTVADAAFVPSLSAVPDAAELGADAIELVTEREPEPAPEPEAPRAFDAFDETLDQPLIDESLIDLPPLEPAAPALAGDPVDEHDQTREEDLETAASAPSSSRRKRMSVPSWDEILFGGADQPN